MHLKCCLCRHLTVSGTERLIYWLNVFRSSDGASVDEQLPCTGKVAISGELTHSETNATIYHITILYLIYLLCYCIYFSICLTYPQIFAFLSCGKTRSISKTKEVSLTNLYDHISSQFFTDVSSSVPLFSVQSCTGVPCSVCCRWGQRFTIQIS